MTPRAPLCLLPLLLLPLACKGAQPQGPDAAYRAFLQHAQALHAGKGEKELLADFDAQTRAALQARAAEASRATSDALSPDPAEQLTLGGASTVPVSEIRVRSLTGREATLEVVLDGGASLPVKMVHEEGRWRVHLDALP